MGNSFFQRLPSDKGIIGDVLKKKKEGVTEKIVPITGKAKGGVARTINGATILPGQSMIDVLLARNNITPIPDPDTRVSHDKTEN